MNMPEWRRILCVMVVMAMVFLVMYPLVYLILPESWARLADLPRDFSLILLLEGVVVPLAALGLYFRARKRALSAPCVPRDRVSRMGCGSGGT
jgi:hypothetical protein